MRWLQSLETVRKQEVIYKSEEKSKNNNARFETLNIGAV
jgi:hypothetical protein